MLRRTIITTGAVSTMLLLGATPAFAGDPWGGVDCDQVPYAGCDLGAGQGRQPGQPSRPQPPGSGQQDDADPSTPRPQGDQIVGDPNLANCGYVRSDYRPPNQGTVTIGYHPPRSGGAVTVTPALYRATTAPAIARPVQQQPPPGQPGAWYMYQCSGDGWRDALYRPPIWIPDGQAAAPSPEQLAQQAYNQLRLPSPQIRANPVGTQLVNLPTWLWLDQSSWGTRSATASVPGVSVTATATPQSVTWSMGDGSTVTCPGAGTPFPTGGNPSAASPDCGHTYTRSSQGQPNNQFPVSASIHWTVTWAGAGQGGTFPNLTTTSSASFAVAESQAVNTN